MHEYSLIVGKDNSYDVFSNAWDMWKQGILNYSAASMSKSKALKWALRDADSEDPSNSVNSGL